MTQGQLHHHLTKLQSRMAGLVPRQSLDVMYANRVIGPVST